MREDLIHFLDSIRTYMRESDNNIGYDDRESSEFVDLYLQNEGENLSISNLSYCSEQYHVLAAKMGDGRCFKCGKELTELNYR